MRGKRLQQGHSNRGDSVRTSIRTSVSPSSSLGWVAGAHLQRCGWVGIWGCCLEAEQAPGCRAGTRVWCWSTETMRPFSSAITAVSCQSRPWEQVASCPRLRACPLHATDKSLPHPSQHSHFCIRLHMQAACMASPLHHPPATWLLWLLLSAALGDLGLSEGGWVLEDWGVVGPFPGALSRIRALPTQPGGVSVLLPPLDVGEGPHPAPCPDQSRAQLWG